MTMSAVGIETVVDRELPSVVESVPYARDLVAWSVPPALRHDVALVVSELVANAVKHGSGPIGLRVDVNEADDTTTVRIAVRDEGNGRPAPDDGYGLHIVGHLAIAMGVDADAHGKTVWAELRARATAPRG